MTFLKFIKQDWIRNHNNTKGRFITVHFRIANFCKGKKLAKLFLTPYLALYRFFFEWALGIKIPYQVKAGSGLRVYHGYALVINKDTVFGENCTLRHSTTIGNKGEFDRPCPVIGDNVNIGAHVCILGEIEIGDNVIIGAGSMVTKSIPSNCVVVGNPARIIKQLNN